MLQQQPDKKRPAHKGHDNANRQFNYNMLSDTKSAADTLTQGKETAGESVGDYSAYVDAGLMTQAQADNAEKIWAIKNPEAAIAIGNKYASLAQAAIAAVMASSGIGRDAFTISSREGRAPLGAYP